MDTVELIEAAEREERARRRHGRKKKAGAGAASASSSPPAHRRPNSAAQREALRRRGEARRRHLYAQRLQRMSRFPHLTASALRMTALAVLKTLQLQRVRARLAGVEEKLRAQRRTAEDATARAGRAVKAYDKGWVLDRAGVCVCSPR